MTLPTPACHRTTGDNLSKAVADSIILSSQKQRWKGLELFHLNKNLKELVAAPVSSHVITFYLNQAIFTWAEIGKLVHQGYLHQNNVTIIPAGVASKWVWQKPQQSNSILLSLQPRFIFELATASELNLEQVEIRSAFGQPDPQIKYIGLALKAELESGCLAGRLYSESLATALAVHILQKYSTSKRLQGNALNGLSSNQQRQVIEYIYENLEQDLNLVELARLVGLSQYYFTRLFKQSMGVAPYQYVLQCRVERAKQLLKQRKLAIAEVALQSGFTDQNHLTRVFRHLTGVTPKVYRETFSS